MMTESKIRRKPQRKLPREARPKAIEEMFKNVNIPADIFDDFVACIPRAAKKVEMLNSGEAVMNAQGQFIVNLTALQQEILRVLRGRKLTKDKIAKALHMNPGSLYKPGGLKALRELGLVLIAKGGGHYRPDAPPPDAVIIGESAFPV